MAGIKGLFKRKPGGTVFGNALRGIVKAAAGAVPFIGPSLSQAVGNGAMMISQEEYDLRNLPDAEYQAKYGTTKTGAVVPSITQTQPQIMTVEQRIDQLKAQNATPGLFQTIREKYLVPAIGAVVALVALVVYFITKRKK
jgi:hypothetical protein